MELLQSITAIPAYNGEALGVICTCMPSIFNCASTKCQQPIDCLLYKSNLIILSKLFILLFFIFHIKRYMVFSSAGVCATIMVISNAKPPKTAQITNPHFKPKD